MRKIAVSGVFLLLCSCHSQEAGQEPCTADSSAAPAFAAARVESSAADLEWRLKQGQEAGPVQIVSCTVNEKQEVELRYRNASAGRIDGVRMVLFGYDDAGTRKDFAENTPYRYVTDQQVVEPDKQASLFLSLQHTPVSKVAAYAVKVHYTEGGSWENH